MFRIAIATTYICLTLSSSASLFSNGMSFTFVGHRPRPTHRHHRSRHVYRQVYMSCLRLLSRLPNRRYASNYTRLFMRSLTALLPKRAQPSFPFCLSDSVCLHHRSIMPICPRSRMSPQSLGQSFAGHQRAKNA
jgi:hypothetical protein